MYTSNTCTQVYIKIIYIYIYIYIYRLFIVSKALLISSATVIVRAGGAIWLMVEHLCYGVF